MNMTSIICKNDKCARVIPPSKNAGRPREFCEEKCRNRYNSRLNYQRQTKGSDFTGLKSVTSDGYPKVNRKPSPNTKAAEKRVKEHGENCIGPGEWCMAKLHDAYNTKKLCLVRAVFTDDWLQLMYADTEPDRPRDMTTEDGMWIDDYKTILAKNDLTDGDIVMIEEARRKKDLELFAEAGGIKSP